MNTQTLIKQGRDLIVRAWALHGRATLACDCGAEEVYINNDGVDFDGDAELAGRLIDHARYAHSGPRAILATLPPVTVVDFALDALVAPAGLTSHQLRAHAMVMNLKASHSSSLDVREYLSAKATAYRAAADALDAEAATS